MKTELNKLHNILEPDYDEYLKNQGENEEVLDEDEEDREKTSGESFLKLTLDFLGRMKKKKLAEYLQHSKITWKCLWMFRNKHSLL